MTFPQTQLALAVELNLGGTWTDITDHVRTSNGVPITRGRSDEASQVDRGTVRLKLDNDGRFSPRNPTGPYYGQLGRNTPIRIGVRRGAVRLDLSGLHGVEATAPDTVALGITGDIDIRLDATIPQWRIALGIALCAKYKVTGEQRSWALWANAAGRVVMRWNTAGTAASAVTVTSTAPVPVTSGRQALRVTVDVDNGAGGNTVRFYTADTISGSWVPLGDPVVTAGVTSLFDSTAGLEVGDIGDFTLSPAARSIHAFELRSGIGGAIVANPDMALQTAGATSFADAAGNTWTVAGGAELTDRHWRFHGEAAAWPVSWDASGNDVYATIEASGILRRLGQGESAIRSTLYRGLVTLADNAPLAYWPLEDASGSTMIASGLPDGIPMTVYGSPSLASSEVFACSAALPTLNNAGMNGKPGAAIVTGVAQVRFLLNIPSAGATDGGVICRIWTAGTIRRWDLRYNTTLSGSYTVLAYDVEGTLLHTSPNSGPLNGRLLRISIEMTQNGADVDYAIWTYEIGQSSASASLGTVTGRTFVSITSLTLGPTLNLSDVTVGHLSIHNAITNIFDLKAELAAYDGESAGARITRLCSEEGIPLRAIGDFAGTEVLGAQTPETLLTLLRECADTDGGMLYEPRQAFGIGYRTRKSLYNQTARIELDYDAGQLAGALDPVDDDQATRNDITVSRKRGSSSRAERTTGPMSTQPPPDGVGRYDDSVTANVAGDARLPNHVGWQLHLGTVDEARYPQVEVNLAAAQIATDPALVAALLDHEFGDRLTVDGVPAWLPPDLISQIVQGYTETMGPFEHRMTLNCSPESPWQVAVYGTDHYDTMGSELTSGVTSSATSLSVATTAGPLWTTAAAHLPLDIKVGGERMTVTAITSAVTDAFGRTVSAGWGTSDSGHAWQVATTASDFSTDGSSGLQSNTTVNATRRAMLPATLLLANADVYYTVSSPAAVGASIEASPMFRIDPAATGSTYLYAETKFFPAGTVQLALISRLANVNTTIVAATTAPGLVHAAGTQFRVRAQVIGDLFQAKVWLASGAEPASWLVSGSASSITAAGRVGVRSLLSTGNTNTLPVGVKFDDIAVTNPQTFAVSRSVNGVVKAHSAGAPVSLYAPKVYAL